MKNLILLIFGIFCFQSVVAQVGMSQWRIFPSPNNVLDVVDGNGKIYGMLENAIMEYDLTSSEITIWTAANYLSDVYPTAIAFNEITATLVVGYRNGNIDLIKNNEIYNLPAIINANTTGFKRINHIDMKGDLAYLSTGVGIVIIDIPKREVKATYHPSLNNEEFIDLTFHQGKIYVITSNRLYKASVNNPILEDPLQWTADTILPDYSGYGIYNSITSFHNSLFFSFKRDSVGDADTLFQLLQGNLSVFKDGSVLKGVNTDNNQLIVSTYNGVYIYSSSYQEEMIIFRYGDGTTPHPNTACKHGAYFYVADQMSGMHKVKNPWNSEQISFPGPRFNSAFRVKWNKGKLSIACGGYDGPSPYFNKDGGITMEDGKWQSINVFVDPKLDPNKVWDFSSTAINPTQTNVVAYGTISSVPLVITKDGKVTKKYNVQNSLLEVNSLTGWGNIPDMAYDEDGNLWVANGLANYPLKVLTKDGLWYEFNLGSSVINKKLGQLIIDEKGVKWLTVYDVGIVAFDEGSSIADKSDDKYKVFKKAENFGNLPSTTVQGIASDIDGNIWAGTMEGMRVLYNTENIFDAAPGAYDFQKLLIKYDGFTEIVLGYTNITDVEVDGGGRKWIATSSAGVFLLSPDGLKIEHKFTVDNSPLISNSILDIGIDRSSGIAYFATSKGMIAYRSDASQGDQEYTNVKVFPNPVRPDYRGPITIQGIAYNSDVHITDISGRLVYKTHSNGGTAIWNGQTLTGERAKTGVYLIWTSIDDQDIKGRKVGKVVFIN